MLMTHRHFVINYNFQALSFRTCTSPNFPNLLRMMCIGYRHAYKGQTNTNKY